MKTIKSILEQAEERYDATAIEHKDILKDTVYGVLEDVMCYVNKDHTKEEIVEYIDSIMERLR